MIEIKKNQQSAGHAYPQRWDKFFRIIKNWFSFVRPLYPDNHWDFRWSNYRSLLEFIAAAPEAELGYKA